MLGVNQARLEELALMVPEDNREQLECPDSPVHKDKADPKVKQELQALTARMEDPASKDLPVKSAALDLLELPAVMEIWESMVHPVSRETEAVKEKPEQLVSLECPEHKEHPDCQEQSAQKDLQEDLERQE